MSPGERNVCGNSLKYVDDEMDFDIFDDQDSVNDDIERDFNNVDDDNCESEDVVSNRSGELKMESDRLIERERKILNDNTFENREWKLGEFNDEWIDQIKTHQSQLIPINEVVKHKDWFLWLPDENNLAHSKWACRVCREMRDISLLKDHMLPECGLKQGTLKSTLQKNRDMISRHPNSAAHKRYMLTNIQWWPKRIKQLF